MSLALEYQTIAKFCAILETAFEECGRKIVNFLTQEGLISESVRIEVLEPRSSLTEAQKAGKLVEAIKRAVLLDKSKFYTLIEVLKTEKFYESTVKRLYDELDRVKKRAEMDERPQTTNQHSNGNSQDIVTLQFPRPILSLSVSVHCDPSHQSKLTDARSPNGNINPMPANPETSTTTVKPSLPYGNHMPTNQEALAAAVKCSLPCGNPMPTNWEASATAVKHSPPYGNPMPTNREPLAKAVKRSPPHGNPISTHHKPLAAAVKNLPPYGNPMPTNREPLAATVKHSSPSYYVSTNQEVSATAMKRSPPYKNLMPTNQEVSATAMKHTCGNIDPMRVNPEALAAPVKHSQPSHFMFPDHIDSAVTPKSIEPLSSNLQTLETELKEQQPVGRYDIKKEVIVRNYHEELAQPGKEGKNFIMVAPTGQDKTIAAALVITDHLNKHRSRHVVFVTESKLLAKKQKETLTDLIPKAKVAAYAGQDFEENPTEINNFIKHQDDISVWTAGKLLFAVRSKNFTFINDLTLIIFDECHHTFKEHYYSKLMTMHLKSWRFVMAQHWPQIIGLTVSPGAGSNPGHLLELAARMDATGGYKTVTENWEELDRHRKSSEFFCKNFDPRDISDDHFSSEVIHEMERLEKKLPCEYNLDMNGLTKLSMQYRTQLQTQVRDLEHTVDRRDDISTLKLLLCYSYTLKLYMDLQQKDAMKAMIEQTGLPDDEAMCTPHERDLKDGLTALLSKIDKYPNENPLLVCVGKTLYGTYKTNPLAQGIIFVPTKRHADGLYDWVLNNPHLKSIVRPDMIIGADRNSVPGMSQNAQEHILTTFCKGHINLLITTLSAEKMDVPECNLIIRYPHETGGISKIQTQGQAKSENSHYCFIASNVKKQYKDFTDEEHIWQVEEILKHFPAGKDLELILNSIQTDIIKERGPRRKLHQLHNCEEVKLLCRRCQTFACNASDVYIKGRSKLAQHHVVPVESFAAKYVPEKHPKPKCYGYYDSEKIKKIDKIYCSNCNLDWGTRCEWIQEGCIFPCLKCKQFLFEINGSLETFVKWINTPFKIKPFTAWLDMKTDQ